jgi:hypothetical protein
MQISTGILSWNIGWMALRKAGTARDEAPRRSGAGDRLRKRRRGIADPLARRAPAILPVAGW